MATFKLQLALQGGGAKFVALVAAMRAIEIMHAEAEIEVTRISGTSAGALVAVLFAAGVPMAEVIDYLEETRTQEFLGRRSSLGTLYRILTGRAVYEGERLLKPHLERLLEKGTRAKAGRGTPQTLNELNIPTILAVSNIQTHRLVERKGGDNLIHSMLESAAYPFMLKGVKSVGNPCLVDGGLCSNLPTELLQVPPMQDNPVIAISFRPETSDSPEGLLSYAKALLETAIDNWVEQTKQKLGANAVYEIDTQITTFQFADILGAALKSKSEELATISDQTRAFVRNFKSNYESRQVVDHNATMLALPGTLPIRRMFPNSNLDSQHDLITRLSSAKREFIAFGLTRNFYADKISDLLIDCATRIKIQIFLMDPDCRSRLDRYRIEPLEAAFESPDRFKRMIVEKYKRLLRDSVELKTGGGSLEVFFYNFPCSFAIEKIDDYIRVMLYGHGVRGTDGPIFVFGRSDECFDYFDRQLQWLQEMGTKNHYEETKGHDLKVTRLDADEQLTRAAGGRLGENPKA